MALIPCEECGKEISDKAPVCPHCGVRFNVRQVADPQAAAPCAPSEMTTANKKLVAGLLGIFLGGFAANWLFLKKFNFITITVLVCGMLTLTGIGVLFVLPALVTFAAGIVELVRGIYWLTLSDEQFEIKVLKPIDDYNKARQ